MRLSWSTHPSNRWLRRHGLEGPVGLRKGSQKGGLGSEHLEEARAAARAGLALAPHFTIASYLAANKFSESPTHLAWRERQADGLRKAGLPEE